MHFLQAAALPVRELFFQRNDVKRIQRVHLVVLADDDDNSLANGNKFRMGRGELAPIRQIERERLESVGDHLPNPFYVHSQVTLAPYMETSRCRSFQPLCSVFHSYLSA